MNNKMISTRGTDHATIDEAILQGLALDGGLYVPESFPSYIIDDFYQYKQIADFACHLLAPFFTDSSIVVDQEFCREVFSFPLPLKQLCKSKYVVELFHGPTLSFKDFGARFFAQCLQDLVQGTSAKVLVATSGDTGSAVASALSGKKGIEGIILFPKDKISPRQQAQITCWEKNIHALAVEGTFDQCQLMVKTALAKGLGTKEVLTTANSINISRILPQVLFYAYSSIQLSKQKDQLIHYIVPSGNLGNVTACYWAKILGFPIGRILIASNKNSVVSDFTETGLYQPRPSITTLANAMDVGDPSNFERLKTLFQDFAEFKTQVNARSINDLEIKAAITQCYEHYDYLICPHTATAYARLEEVNDNEVWVIAATAHPAKFEGIIEPLLKISIPIPGQLNRILKRSQEFKTIQADYKSLLEVLQ